MTQEQFQDALGMIDDDLVESVDKLRQQREFSGVAVSPHDPHAPMDSSNTSHNIYQVFRKKIQRREIIKWGSLAASICLFIGVGFLWTVGGNKTADYAPGTDNQYSQQENLGDIHMEGIHDIKPETASPTKSEFSDTSIPSPPGLYIVMEENDSIQAMTATYSWHWSTEDGIMFREGDSYHPLQSQEYITLIETTKPTVQLQFDTFTHGAPYAVSVQCWSDAYWNQINVEGLPLTVTDGQIPLQEGGTIYQVQAKWSSGTVYYVFYVNYTPDPS